jgi:hypothetical protein
MFVAAYDRIRAGRRVLPLGVCVFLGHPALPVGPGLLAVSIQASAKPHVQRRLDPDGEGEERPKCLARCADALQDHEVAGLERDLWLRGTPQLVGL